MTTFFFAPESPRSLALVRIALGLVLLVEAAARWPFAVELYSSAGLPMPPFAARGLAPPVPGPAVAVGLHSLLLFALVAVTIGWQTRLSLLVAVGLLGWFSLLDFPATLTKYTAIALHLLALLACSRCGGVWSVDARLGSSRSRQTLADPSRQTLADTAKVWATSATLGAAWPRRLIQILVCSVYWGAAVTKIRLPDFATGDLVEFALLSDRWGGTHLGLWLSTRPTLVQVTSFATLAFELFFPVLVWVGPLRRPMLVCAVVFHGLLALTMHLGAFSFVMLAALLAFVRDRDLGEHRHLAAAEPGGAGPETASSSPAVAELARVWPIWRHSPGQSLATSATGRPSPRGSAVVLASLGAYAALAAVAAFSGVLVQRSADWYAVFGRRGHDSPPALDQAAVDRILAQQKPDYADLVHRFEIGSRRGYRRTFGSRTAFRHGMTVHALVRFVLNDETLSLEWLLVAPDGREVARHPHELAAGMPYASVAFRLTPDAPIGRYRIILHIDGAAVAERTFSLLGGEQEE